VVYGELESMGIFVLVFTIAGNMALALQRHRAGTMSFFASCKS
jgi:hypothetical protein